MPSIGVPSLEDLLPLEGRRVLLRADFNVPVHDGVITDDLRIRAALPTIVWLQEHGATVVACTHFGRPKGEPDPRYDVAPIRARLAELAPGVELLENLRFNVGETTNDPGFVAGVDELDPATLRQRREHGDVGVAAQAEHVLHAAGLEILHQLVGDRVLRRDAPGGASRGAGAAGSQRKASASRRSRTHDAYLLARARKQTSAGQPRNAVGALGWPAKSLKLAT